MRLHKHLDKLRQMLKSQSELTPFPPNPSAEICLEELRSSISVARRDSLDSLTATLLRDAAVRAPKRDAIAFIGTGNVWENTVYACEALAKANKQITPLDYLFVCRSKHEHDLLQSKGLKCAIWKHQAQLADYLLQCKWVVLASHSLASPGNCLLSACISGAKKLQLWHGYPAKQIAHQCVPLSGSIHQAARLAEDTLSVDAVTTPSRVPESAILYKRAFPNAEQFVTGDPRTDPLFARAEAPEHNIPLRQWLRVNKALAKIVVMPTFRDTASKAEAYHQAMLEFIRSLLAQSPSLAVAVKLHPAAHHRFGSLLKNCGIQDSRLLVLDGVSTGIYETLPHFDALLTDYSSIRFDFLALEKPIFLWRPDSLQRANLEGIFARLDALAYTIPPEHPDLSLLSDLITRDPLRDQRAALAREVHAYRDGKSSQRVAELIGQLVTKGLPATQT
jgi:CDP-glycerol glycerophosphotransferase